MKEKVENQSARFNAVQSMAKLKDGQYHEPNAFASSATIAGKVKMDATRIDIGNENEGNELSSLWQTDHGKLVEQTYSMAVIMMDCFATLNDKVLYAKVKTTKSDLCLLPDSQLIVRAKEIARLGRNQLDVLAAYRIHELIIDELEDTIADFTQLTSPRDACDKWNNTMAANHDN